MPTITPSKDFLPLAEKLSDADISYYIDHEPGEDTSKLIISPGTLCDGTFGAYAVDFEGVIDFITNSGTEHEQSIIRLALKIDASPSIETITDDDKVEVCICLPQGKPTYKALSDLSDAFKKCCNISYTHFKEEADYEYISRLRGIKDFVETVSKDYGIREYNIKDYALK